MTRVACGFPALVRSVLTSAGLTWYIGCRKCKWSASWLAVCLRNGGCSSVGGTPDCGLGGRGFESRQSPRFCASCGGRVRKTPNLVRLVRFGVFCCYCGQKWTLGEGVGYRLTPGLYDTSRRAFNRAVGNVLIPERTKRSRRCPLACALFPRGIEGRHPPLQLPAS